MVWAELPFHLFTLRTKNLLWRSEQLVPLSWTFQKTLCDWTWSWACCLSRAVLPFYFHVRERRRECVNSSACWPCRHGEHCWTVKAWVWYRLRSGLIFVSGRRDQQKDSLRVQLCHNSSDSRSLAYSSALLQAQLDLQPSFPPITTHFHSSGLLSVWKVEPLWKKQQHRNPYSISSSAGQKHRLWLFTPVQNHNPCFKNEWSPRKQKTTCSVVILARSWWQHSQCVTGIQTSYSVSPFLGNDFFEVETCHRVPFFIL